MGGPLALPHRRTADRPGWTEGEAPGTEVGDSRPSRPAPGSVSGDLKPCRGRGLGMFPVAITVPFTRSLCASLFFPVQTPRCQRGPRLMGKSALCGGLSQRRPGEHSGDMREQRGGWGAPGRTGDPARESKPLPPRRRQGATSHAGSGASGPERAHLRGPWERARAPTGEPRPETGTASQESEAAGLALRTGAGTSLTGAQPCTGHHASLGEGCIPQPGCHASPCGPGPPGTPRREQRAPPQRAMLV